MPFPEPPPVDFAYVSTQGPRATVTGTRAHEMGLSALGQLGARTVRLEQSHYGIAIGSTLSFFQQPAANGGVCEQTVYEVQTRRTATELSDLSAEQYLQRQVTGQGYSLGELTVRHQYAPAAAGGGCDQVSGWTRAASASDYSVVMGQLDRIRTPKPNTFPITIICQSSHGTACPADPSERMAAFWKSPILVIQRVDGVATAESYRERLVIWSAPVRGSLDIRIEAARLEDKPPPPLS